MQEQADQATNAAESWLQRMSTHNGSPALLCGGRRVDYGELSERARAVAQALLAQHGPLEGRRVAVRLPATPDFVTMLLGCWLAGGMAVPLSLAASDRELRQSLTTAAGGILVDAGVHDSDPAWQGLLGQPPAGWAVTEIDTSARSTKAGTLPALPAEAAALMLFTSGTTGVPKGVVHSHASLRAQLEQLGEAWAWQADDRIPLFLPTHHVHGLVNILLCALWHGASVDLLGGLDADALLDSISQDAYTLLMAVPTIYTRLAQAMDALPEAQRIECEQGLARLRLMVSGSAALPAGQQRDWRRRTGQDLLERYGMTETGMLLSNLLNGERRAGTVGQPLPGVRVRLVDEQGAEQQGEGAEGEIQVRGPGLFTGYWQQPDITAASFDNGWFRTGDLAVLEDGYYRILGRRSQDIIKSGGYKLSALEIEQVLLDHPDILECAVVGLDDPQWGEAVAAAVVLRPGSTENAASLKEWFRSQASHYRTPRHWQFLAELPRNAMGKVSKPQLKSGWPPL